MSAIRGNYGQLWNDVTFRSKFMQVSGANGKRCYGVAVDHYHTCNNQLIARQDLWVVSCHVSVIPGNPG